MSRELTFEQFKHLAQDKTLTRIEKIGFPNSYRQDYEQLILSDIDTKLQLSSSHRKKIIDIGCGCSHLVDLLADLSASRQHQLVLIDSQPMLDLLPSIKNIKIYPGHFPDIPNLASDYHSQADCVLVYSVIHYVFANDNLYQFIHRALDLLKPNGRLLIGDIPNTSKKNRFLTTPAGKKFIARGKRLKLTGDTAHDDTSQKIDDAIIVSILQRFRNLGHETYLLPQDTKLPMANRREDILIIKH